MNDVKTPSIIAFVLSYECADASYSFFDRQAHILGCFLQLFPFPIKKCVFFFTFFSHCLSVQSVPPIRNSWAPLMSQWFKNPPAMHETQEMWVWSLDRGGSLEEEMATHSSMLAWKIPRAEKLQDSYTSVLGAEKATCPWDWYNCLEVFLIYSSSIFITSKFFFFFFWEQNWLSYVYMKARIISKVLWRCWTNYLSIKMLPYFQ